LFSGTIIFHAFLHPVGLFMAETPSELWLTLTLLLVSSVALLVGGMALWIVYRIHAQSKQAADDLQATTEQLTTDFRALQESIRQLPSAVTTTNKNHEPILARLNQLHEQINQLPSAYDTLRGDVTHELQDLAADLRRLPWGNAETNPETRSAIATRIDQRMSSLHHRFDKELAQTLTEASEDGMLPASLSSDLSLLLTRAISEAARSEQDAYSDTIKEAILRELTHEGETLTALDIIERLAFHFPAQAVFTTLERMASEGIIHTGYSRVLFKTSAIRIAH